MYVVLERNHAFLNFKHGVRSVQEIQAIGSDHIFGYLSPTISAVASPQRYQPRPTHRSKVRVKIQVKIEYVLLWSVIHAIWIGTESMLRLFVRLR